MRHTFSTVLTGVALASAMAADYNAIDDLGVRVFSEVPPPGVHPRVLLSPSDLPAWRESVIKTHKGQAFFSKRYQSKLVEQLASADPATPEEELVKQFPNQGPGGNHQLLFATLDAVYHQDADRAKYVAKAVANFARVVLARSKYDPQWGKVQDNVGNVAGLRGISAGLGHLWLRGGQGFALSYDFLYNDMTTEQRAVCRRALSEACKDLVTWGMGFPKGRAVSNWYGYHGELAVMLLAIEGEEGFLADRWRMFAEMMRNWLEVAFYDTGGGNEDGYMANTALREGTFALIAMARRGENLFCTPQYRNYWKWAVYSLIPGEHGGETVGYTCDAMHPYESMPTLSRWASPGNPLINYYFRQFKGDDYSKNNRWQYADMSLLFALDFEDTDKLPLDAKKLNLPLTAYFPFQGLLVTRSDWTDDCVYLNVLARHDAWYDRHENVDRGRFVLCAGGRQWAVDRSWGNYQKSTDHSLVHLDGQAEAEATVGRGKAPNGRVLAQLDTPTATAVSLDLKNAYDWLWAHSWDKPGEGWEPETRSFAELGWTWNRPGQPPALHGADDPASPRYNFQGCNLWRKANNPVQRAFRTCVLVRGPRPYVLILDDVVKDDAEHLYEWYMQVAEDLALKQSAGQSLLVEQSELQQDRRPAAGTWRLLVRPLGGSCEVKLEDYLASENKGVKHLGHRLILGRRAREGNFSVLLFPFRTTAQSAADWQQHPTGATMPKTWWNDDRTQLTVALDDHRDVFTFSSEEGRATFALARDGKLVGKL